MRSRDRDARDQEKRGQEDGERQEELGEAEEHGGDGQDLPGEVDLPDQVAVAHDAPVEAVREPAKKFQGSSPASRK